MSLFKKTSDVVDLTKLQKRGIKISQAPQQEQSPQSEYLNLGDTSQSADSAPSQFDFLNSLANTSTNSAPTYPTQNSDISIKIENLEYKIERFLERLDIIEKKINDFERKVN